MCPEEQGRPHSVMAHLRRIIVEVKAEQNCFAHDVLIAIAKVENDPDYDAFPKGRKIRPVVETILETNGIDLSTGGGILELVIFQEHFREYKIVVYQGLNCDNIMFEEQVDSAKRLNILYDDIEETYHVITNLTRAMAGKYVCKGCNKACTSDVTHVCEQTCRDCMVCPRAHSGAFEYPA